MRKLSFNNIMSIIKSNFTIDEYAYGYYSDSDMHDLGLGNVIVVDKYGGEDMGSTWYSVKHFVDHDVYIRTDGYYSSYDGVDYNGIYGYEVRPEEVTVTVYKEVPVVDNDRILTGDELISLLLSDSKKSDFGEDEIPLNVDIFGDNDITDTVGNHQNGGSYAHVIRYFKRHDVYVKLIGHYSSYSGCDWHGDYNIVKPVQKTITAFE